MRNALLGLIVASALTAPASLYAAVCGAAKPDAQDAVAVSPDIYKVLIDNETIRILDTRNGTGGRLGPLGPGGSFDLQVTGRGGVPASGVDSVVMNVTATEPTSSSVASRRRSVPSGASAMKVRSRAHA